MRVPPVEDHHLWQVTESFEHTHNLIKILIRESKGRVGDDHSLGRYYAQQLFNVTVTQLRSHRSTSHVLPAASQSSFA